MLKSVRNKIKTESVDRSGLFASLYIIACANGLTARIVKSIHSRGWFDATVGNFDVSIIVWVACFVGVSLVLSERAGKIQKADLVLSAALLLLIALPIGATSWLAVAILSLYILFLGRPADSLRRGAIVLLAVTIPMFWSRVVFNLFARYILEIDAIFVRWVLGTERTGNLVEFVDHSGSLAILPSCSSLANVSLALLCWATVSQFARHKWRSQDILWCLLACFSVFAVNVLRVSLMGVSGSFYLMLHSPPVEVLLSIIMLGLVVSISLAGIRHDSVIGS
ncbi:hypothetical protein [Nitrobacter winogradskyi]|uniref:Uncharacterized protein n=1 Tax=Nitrobacter winogradskyi TaxID=913 RepID=A0ACC6AQS0_NITWI|nr:hypothetical protein [Nitrobacter winogradskyi]MCP2001270.1 hypothetical protein [Nitrobacter winogradskyi]